MNAIELLEVSKIQSYLTALQKQQLTLHVFEELSSTNDYLLQEAKSKHPAPIACFAEKQTAGRGRLGRTWASPYAENIYLSLLWHFPFDLSHLIGLNIVVGIALIKVIHKITDNQHIKLKWPNDVYYENKKLAGVLIDLLSKENDTVKAVIGIGLNVLMKKEDAKQIEKPWISLADITTQPLSRNEIAGCLLAELMQSLALLETQGLTHFINAWQDYDYLFGKTISVVTGKETLQGVAMGLNEQGFLRLRTEDQKIIIINSGDASILR